MNTYKVLHIIGKGDVGGITSVVYNYAKFIDKSKIQFDIACVTNDKIGEYGNKFKALGCNVYKLPFKSESYKKYKQELTKLIITNKYDAIHSHAGTDAYLTLKVAKKLKVPQRIIHTHSSFQTSNLNIVIRKLTGKLLNPIFANTFIACGKLAGEKTFGKSFLYKKDSFILPNAVDTNTYYFDKNKRNELRKKLNLTNKYVVGFAGRLAFPKNALYAVKLMQEIHNKIPNASLLIAGDGEDKKTLEAYISNWDMSNYVKILGFYNDMKSLYQAFDILIMPSKYEGFPLVAAEAMSCGLPIVLSSSITNELNFGSQVYYINLKDRDKWVDKICNLNNFNQRENTQHELKSNGYDIKDVVCKLENIYLNFGELLKV